VIRIIWKNRNTQQLTAGREKGTESKRKPGAEMEEREDKTIYKVVINHEEQYSIWPADRENPLGWKDVGKVGSKAECLAHIKEVWTDMRPLSLRKKMDKTPEKP
jgi:MbtH protein